MKTSMPKQVRIGPHVYNIVRRTPQQMPDDLGLCEFDGLRISVRERLRRSKAQEILLHELLHACTYPTLNTSEKYDDETFVTAVAPVVLHMFQDNPELVKYLTE